MRASKSNIQSRIFRFHGGGMIWRTRARFSDVRNPLQHPLYELRKTKGTSKSQIPLPRFDIKFPLELAASGGTSNRRQGLLLGSQRSSTRPGNVETSCENVAANPRRSCAIEALVTF